jgi:hypothetical protein
MLASFVPKIEKGLWAVIGMVGELSSILFSEQEQTIKASVRGRAFFSMVQASYQRNGYDFLISAQKLIFRAFPRTFSGGGLWEIGLSMEESGKLCWDGNRHFRGVEFGQTKISGGRRMIRCHGPQSIFAKAWGEWAFPEGK